MLPRQVGDEKSRLLPAGVILNGNLKEVLDVDPRAPDQVQEFVTHSWFKYPDEKKGLHPWDGITEANFVLGPKTKGKKTAIENLDESAKYSFVKAPSWKGHAMEVGPLARYIVGYAKGVPEIKEPVDKLLRDLDVPIRRSTHLFGPRRTRLEASWAAHI